MEIISVHCLLFEADIPNANITRVPAVLVQSRGVIDVVYYEKPFTAEDPVIVRSNMRKLYDQLARKLGYTKTGLFYVKKLG